MTTPEDKADQVDQAEQTDSAEKFRSMAESIQKLNATIDELGDSDEAKALRAELALLVNDKFPTRIRDRAPNATENILGPNPIVGLQGKDFSSVAMQITKGAITNQKRTLTGLFRLGRDVMNIVKGDSEIAPKKGDRRFSDNTWQTNPIYKGIMQSYLAWCNQLNELSDDLMETEDDKRRARFMISLITDAAAPTNTLINPSALKRILETGGTSLVKGAEHLIDDIKNNGAMPSMVDTSAFEVGKNLACTKGSVIYRNELLELIQYAPVTDQVYHRPLLFIPPQINKYYVLDLSPKNSLMKFLVEQGFQTFTICWRNPTIAQREMGLGDYVDSVIEAIDAIRDITGETVNIMGACSGGITSAVTLAYLEKKGQREEKINSLTLLVSMLDTDTSSELALFSSEQSIDKAKKHSHTQGFIDSGEMGRAFAWLRPNDLIWNYWVNNYLLGNSPPAFDILYWNADGTRMTAALHADFLDIFIKNALVNDDDLYVNDTHIELDNINCDVFSLAGTTDHITPWKTCYKSFKLLDGKGEFVLSNSGHIQSLVNPPSNPKASFYTNKKKPDSPDDWYEQGELQQGSWWLYWKEWLGKKSSTMVDAPERLGNENYPALMDAPGNYIHD